MDPDMMTDVIGIRETLEIAEDTRIIGAMVNPTMIADAVDDEFDAPDDGTMMMG